LQNSVHIETQNIITKTKRSAAAILFDTVSLNEKYKLSWYHYSLTEMREKPTWLLSKCKQTSSSLLVCVMLPPTNLFLDHEQKIAWQNATPPQNCGDCFHTAHSMYKNNCRTLPSNAAKWACRHHNFPSIFFM